MATSDERRAMDELEAEARALLRAAGVPSRDLALTADEEARTAAVAERALADIRATDRPAASVRRRRRHLVGRAVGVVAVAAALAVAAVVVRPGGDGAAAAQTPALLHFRDVKDGTLLSADETTEATRSRESARLFESLAQKAGEQPEPPAGTIQRVVVEGWWASIEDGDGSDERPGGAVLIPTRVESFYLPDGRMRSVSRRGTPLDDDGRISEKKGTWLDTPTTSDEIFDASDPGPDYPQTLSNDPTVLAAQLTDDKSPECASHLSWCLLNEIGTIHRFHVVSPALRAAMWRTLEGDPSVTVLGPTTDRLGRSAVAFVVDALDARYRLVVLADPDTGAWLGDETILVKPVEGIDFTPPAVVELTVLVSADRVEPDDLPPGDPVEFD